MNKLFDILHCHFGPNGLIGAYLKDIGVVKRLIVTFHGSDITGYPFRHGKGVYKTLYEQADAITVGTHFVEAKLIQNGCPPGKIRIIPAGIRMEEHNLLPLHTRDPYLVLSVGRLIEAKGFRYAIEAFQKVVQRIPQARYVIVGNGPERSTLEGLIQKLGISTSVELAGEKIDHEIHALYQQASLFILPSIVTSKGIEEGQGLVLQEAQAWGLPVIATRVGGIPEGILDGVTGYLVPPEDSSSLAEKIIYLLEHPDIRKQMGEAGESFVRERFNVEIITQKLIQLYDSIL